MHFYNSIHFSLTCDGSNENNCLSCNITDTFRSDLSPPNTEKKCPCNDGYYHNNAEICSECNHAWFPYISII